MLPILVHAFPGKLRREARRRGRITELRPVVSFRPVQLSQPILNSAPPSEVRQCSRYGAGYCVTTPAQLCIFSHQVGFPSSPQSKKAKTAARKLKNPKLLPGRLQLLGSRGGKQPKRTCIRAVETVWRTKRHADVAGRLSAAVAAANAVSGCLTKLGSCIVCLFLCLPTLP